MLSQFSGRNGHEWGDATRAMVRAGDTGGLKVSFGDKEFILFRTFKGAAQGVDSALALLEHVTAEEV